MPFFFLKKGKENRLFIKNADQMGDRLTGQINSGRITQNSLMQRADGGNNQGCELTDAEPFSKRRGAPPGGSSASMSEVSGGGAQPPTGERTDDAVARPLVILGVAVKNRHYFQQILRGFLRIFSKEAGKMATSAGTFLVRSTTKTKQTDAM